MNKSKFISDLHAEEILGEFLEKYLYSKLNITNFYKNSPTIGIHSLNNQFLGIDIAFSFKGTEYKVDEKATLHYPDGLSTFAFEIKYRKLKVWKTGWLFDNKKHTNYYLLAWPKRNSVDLDKLTIGDIQKVEVMLISRKDIHNYLVCDYGLTQNIIENEANSIIKNNKYGKLNFLHPSSKNYYYYTKSLVETPINIIIKKSTLKNLAIFHFMVYRNTPYSKNPNSNIWLKDKYRLLQNS